MYQRVRRRQILIPLSDYILVYTMQHVYGNTSVGQSGTARTIVVEVGFGRIGCMWPVRIMYNNRTYGAR